MNKNQVPSAGARVSDAAGNALEAATQVLESGRQYAAEAAGRIGETSRELGDSAGDLLRAGARSVGDARVGAQRKFGNYAQAGRRYVEREPLNSALIAAAIGAAMAALVMAISSGRRHRD